MTKTAEIKTICAICGAKSTHVHFMSTHFSGFADLDARPPLMARKMVYWGIQRCPSCGYCNYDIAEPTDKAKEIIDTRGYQNILEDKTLPKESISYLASAYIQQELGCFSCAAWDAICAAWICDDEGNATGAEQCRKKAIELIEIGEGQSQRIVDEEGDSEAITVDLMRRAGLFASALKLVEKLKGIDAGEALCSVVAFQERLILAEDRNRYTMGDALGKIP